MRLSFSNRPIFNKMRKGAGAFRVPCRAGAGMAGTLFAGICVSLISPGPKSRSRAATSFPAWGLS